MPLAVETDPSPIRVDSDGAVRVGDSRVRLESIVHRYREGATPEQIHESFPSVSLPDVYATVAYYLRHQEEIDAFIAEGEVEADRMQAKLEAEHPTQELRERLRRVRDEN